MSNKVSNITAWILVIIALVSLAFLMAYPRGAGATGVVNITWTGPQFPTANTAQTYTFTVTNNTDAPVNLNSYPQCGFPANNAFCSGMPGQTTVTVPVGATVSVPYTFTILNPGGTFQVYGFYRLSSSARYQSMYVNVTPVPATKKIYTPIILR